MAIYERGKSYMNALLDKRVGQTVRLKLKRGPNF